LKTDVLKQLAEDIAAYEQTYGELDHAGLKAFYAYQGSRGTELDVQQVPSVKGLSQQPTTKFEIWELAKFITYLNRFARYYSKAVFEGQSLHTLDEFAFIAELVGQHEAARQNPAIEAGITKAELSDRHLHERTTGMEIITRLLDKGFLDQKPSNQDRRAKVLSLTPMGWQAFFAFAPVLAEMGNHIAGNLSEAEVQHLASLLARLDAYHRPFFKEKRAQEVAYNWHQNVAQAIMQQGGPQVLPGQVPTEV
jgi:DNA-binding MarR family transcriptional regulator